MSDQDALTLLRSSAAEVGEALGQLRGFLAQYRGVAGEDLVTLEGRSSEDALVPCSRRSGPRSRAVPRKS
jgi:hypothetical protein